ncbi:hypothetical protein [Spirosoma validum]|uniref:SbsA Ig-like domain-containing protein n=1 Tax=Spirosoma validum TaxID=2771355 RepID=A0A927B7U8_9BACT|nr:hypothetical protein [Spirosoma validum]MBD2757065.1 hypothetical protein [Spirosoma validum]
MIGIYNNRYQVVIRLYALYSLIFFIASLLIECHSAKEKEITIRWQNRRAIGISIPKGFIDTIDADSLEKQLSVRLTNQKTAIAGQYQLGDGTVIFEPLIPFTRGLRYVVWLNDKRLGEVSIPALDSNDRPALLGIYPSQDSLPENLLKIYLHFSRPMRERQSQKYVTLLKNNNDTLSGVFLDLQPELWNPDRTILTLWLDPGRIKRDLQPNKRLGAPLQTHNRYKLVVTASWPDEQGATLEKDVTKSFVAIQRDSLSPNPKKWTLLEPKSGSLQSLDVSFSESLDYSLLTETLSVIREDGANVPGRWQSGEEEKLIRFKPNNVWQSGRYKLRIESRLEDLAGNNVNRLFDRDITRKDQRATSESFTELLFKVR